MFFSFFTIMIIPDIIPVSLTDKVRMTFAQSVVKNPSMISDIKGKIVLLKYIGSNQVHEGMYADVDGELSFVEINRYKNNDEIFFSVNTISEDHKIVKKDNGVYFAKGAGVLMPVKAE